MRGVLRTGLVFALGLAGSGAARAQPASPPLTLSWSAPEECPTRAAIESQVGALLGGSARVEQPVAADAVVTRRPTGYRLALDTVRDGVSGARTLDADSCDALGRAAALLLALTVDPGRAIVDAPYDPQKRPPASVEPPPRERPPKAPPTTAAAPSEAPDRPRVGVFGAPVADGGSLPSVSGGFLLGVAWLSRPVRLEVNGGMLFPTAKDLPSGSGGSFSLLTGGVRACGAVSLGRFELGPCVGVAVVRTNVVGQSSVPSASPLSDSALSGAGVLGADAFWEVRRRFGLRLRVDGVAPTARPRFVVERQDERIFLHRAAAIGVRGALGLELRFL